MQRNEERAFQVAIQQVQGTLPPEDYRRKWLPYLYHHTDLTNVVGILRHDVLYGREDALAMGLLSQDAANHEIIEQTIDQVRGCARLYFRPKSPTLFSIEGFRPLNSRPAGAPHCPVPIVLCFRAANILARSDVVFTSVNAATPTPLLAGVNSYLELPWNDILHSSSLFNDHNKRLIILSRHAEVLVPSPMPVSKYLAGLYCRSEAEYETLQTMIRREGMYQWMADDRIRRAKTADLFYFQWVYIDQVSWTGESLILGFNPPAQNVNRGPFRLRVEFSVPGSEPLAVYENDAFSVPIGSNSLSFRLDAYNHLTQLHIVVSLDGRVGYDNSVMRVK